ARPALFLHRPPRGGRLPGRRCPRGPPAPAGRLL
ncbi:MAG: hypothetical protein AVDCRST_MAG08-791, partial [uncultured Acetobacteraceae bacterium]